VAEAVVDGQAVRLIEPQLYMNRSGQAVRAVEGEIAPNHLIVVHDDVDLECGTVRVKCGGGSGGHRGVESMIEHFGSEFIRIRVGIGRPLEGQEAAAFVLAPFSTEERELIDAAVDRAAAATECVVRSGSERAMNRFNVRHVEPASGSVTGRT
jgi:PTH1 family peptidyl-tRNA hydrolase